MKHVRIGEADLYLGDCREILPTLDRADLMVADPPYGIGYTHSGGGGIFVNGERKSTKFGNTKIVGDDAPFEPGPEILNAAEALCLWGAIHYANSLPLKPGDRWLAWDKGFAEVPTISFSHFEAAWTSRKGACRLKKWVWHGCFRQEEGNREGRVHPTQKPIGIMRWSIEQTAPRARTVLDPFMGSGTTGVACAQLGKRFVGIEIDPGYFDTACSRIEAAQTQGTLLAQSEPEPEQTDLLEERP